jgi:hypothetical protein
MWSDRDSKTDFLNFTELAEQISSLARSPEMLPVSVGVFGTWGTGKSTVLNLVRQDLENHDPRPLVIEFDAWLFQGFDDSKAALMEVVADTLVKAAKDDEGLLGKAKALAARVNYFRAIGVAADFGIGMALGVPPGLLTKAGDAISSLMSGNVKGDDVEAAKAAGKAASEEWGKLIKPEKARTPPKEIAAFRKEFGEILEKLGRPLVVFIDNLDRCLPDVAIGTLEAIRLFLFMPGTSFVIAADEDMIRHSVARHFRDPDSAHVKDYLDKVIQVPFRVPRIGAEDVRAYLYSLFTQLVAPAKLADVQAQLLAALQNSWQDASFDATGIDRIAGQPEGLLDMLGTADRVAPILAMAPNIGGNPRIVKRLLNAVLLRRGLAVSRKMNVDLATLLKLAVFERVTDAAATEALYTMVMGGGDGARLLIQPGFAMGKDEERPASPAAWKGLEPFVEQWRELEPHFTDPDALRPALFLSRDVLAPAVRGGPADGVLRAVETLMAVTSTNSPAALGAIDALTDEERVAAMGVIVGKLREADWSNKFEGIHGAVILGGASAGAKRQLAALVETMPVQSMHGGTRFMLKRMGYIQGD